MLVTKPVGRNASAMKYDILSALAVHALTADKHTQRLSLRLSALITTRYNWRSGELSMGREEMARLWSVNERTVKREMARLRGMGWISVKRPGARGRVTVYKIGLAQILRDTRPAWDRIGPDFVDRMGAAGPEKPETKARDSVVPFRLPGADPAPEPDSVWGEVQTILHERDPEIWSSWFRHLVELDRAGGTASLLAPSRFVADYVAAHWTARILSAYAIADPSVRRLKIEARG